MVNFYQMYETVRNARLLFSKIGAKIWKVKSNKYNFRIFFRRLIEIITFVVFNYRENESKFERSKEFVS